MKKFGLFILLAVAAFVVWRWWNTPAPLSVDVPQGPLPDTVTPMAYVLDLDIDPTQERFKGHVEIRSQLHRSAKQIWLHGEGLNVADAAVLTAEGLRIPARYQEQGDSGIVSLSFDRELPAQTLTLVIDYDAPFGDTLRGLYKVEDGGRPYAFTQMEPISARLAFPGFDEPRFKVPFDVSLTVRADHVAIANTPAQKETLLADGRKKIQFATTKPLPTYLLAWAVGELDVVEWAAIPASDIRAQPIPLRGIATKGKGEKMRYALDNTAAIVNLLEQYFAIPYPYEKLDLLAVPDFDAGAMENAGAITYREQLLLLDEASSLDQKRAYVSTHAHELAHQWFGNLVTMQWWTDLWLNEAFASWLENKVARQFAPQMGFELSYQKDARTAMQTDVLASAREIRQPITLNVEIDNAFDGITYSKGSAVIAMFEQFVGEEVFRNGVRAYMQKHAFANATSEDFIQAIADAAQNPQIRSAFNSFLTQGGMPRVAMQWQCIDNTVSATLGQSRFTALGTQTLPAQRWQIPVCVSTNGSDARERHCTLLTEATQNWSFSVKQCPVQLLANADASGYYRLHIEKSGWQALLDNLPKLSVQEAFDAALNASMALRAGELDVNGYLAMVPAFVAHPHGDVQTLPMDTLTFVRDYVVVETDRENLSRFYARLYRPRFERLGLQPKAGESSDDIALRNQLLGFLVDVARDEALRAPLRDMGKAYIGFGGDGQLHRDAVSQELAGRALIVAAQDLGEPFFRALEKMLDDTDDGTVRGQLITAMARSTDPKLAEEARGMVTGLGLRTNERLAILGSQMADAQNSEALWQWFQGKFSLLKPLMPAGVVKQAPMIGVRFCSDEKARELEAFFAPKMADIPGAELSLANTLERIRQCAALVKAQPAIQWEPLAAR